MSAGTDNKEELKRLQLQTAQRLEIDRALQTVSAFSGSRNDIMEVLLHNRLMDKLDSIERKLNRLDGGGESL